MFCGPHTTHSTYLARPVLILVEHELLMIPRAGIHLLQCPAETPFSIDYHVLGFHCNPRTPAVRIH